ncbi:hypothetical protein T12_7126 [Trichinella patagoniensis]|uniref:Uncharacterized protein n=1 Tax=Trichinella patagoniensis TaxID=990121 RepID=A0A0V0YV17_9BILA|nr:hypothetical protein T12_7126 [Trichinella patagoniensis]
MSTALFVYCPVEACLKVTSSAFWADISLGRLVAYITCFLFTTLLLFPPSAYLQPRVYYSQAKADLILQIISSARMSVQ